jgi:hypothetical protein
MTADTISSSFGFSNFLTQSFVASVGQQFTYSFYILKTVNTTNGLYGGFSVEFRTAVASIAEYGATINSDAGSLISANGWGTSGFISSYVVDAGNYWRIVAVTPNAPATTTVVRVYHGVSGYFLNGTRINTGSSSKVIWGTQLEAGANATSYIPTVASAVTRNADTSNILLTGKNIMNNNNFTIYCEANWLNNLTNSGSIALSDTAAAVGGSTRFGWFNGGSAILRNAGVGTSFIDATLGRTKLILKREGTELKWFKNGAQIWTTQIVPVTSYNYLVITNGGSTFTLNNLEIYKESFSDAECIALTTL